MKTRCLVAMAILLLQVPLLAQEKQIPPAEARASRLTEWMKTNLQLTETQLPQVTEINLKYAKQTDALRKNDSPKKQKMQAMKTADQNKDKELQALLTESQFKTYLVKKEEMKQKMKEKRKRNEGI